MRLQVYTFSGRHVFFFPADFQIMKKNAQKKSRRVSTDFLVFRRVFFRFFDGFRRSFPLKNVKILKHILQYTVQKTTNNQKIQRNSPAGTDGHRQERTTPTPTAASVAENQPKKHRQTQKTHALVLYVGFWWSIFFGFWMLRSPGTCTITAKELEEALHNRHQAVY